MTNISFTSVDGVPVMWSTWETKLNCDACETGEATTAIVASYSPWATGDPDDDLQSTSCICEGCGGRLRAEMEMVAEIRNEIALRERRAAKKRREREEALRYGLTQHRKPIIPFDSAGFHQPALFSSEWLQGC